MELIINQKFRDLIPEISSEEYQLLEESILNEGCREAIVTWNGCILDGHNRYEICQKHHIGFKTLEKEFDNEEEAKIWIIHNQLARRNLPVHERTRLALLLKPAIEEKAKEKQRQHGGTAPGKSLSQKSDEVSTKKELAKLAGVSHDTVRKVETIEKEGSPEIKDAVRKGKISVNKAYKHVRGKDKDQAKIKAKPKSGFIGGDSWKLQEMKERAYKAESQWKELSETDKKKFVRWLKKKYGRDSVFGILLQEHIINPKHPTFTSDLPREVLKRPR